MAPNAKGVVGTLKGAVGSIKKDPLQAGAHLMNAAVASTPGQAAMGSVAALKNRYGEMMSKDPGRPWGPGTGL